MKKQMKIKIEGKYTASIIGLLFTGIVFIATYTLIIPMLTLTLPGLLENIFSVFFGNSPYKTIGISVLISLLLIFIITTYLMFKVIFKQKQLLIKKLYTYFTFQVFIIPPIFFYLKTSRNWETANDGQFIFGIVEVFPLSCFIFVIIGVIIDIVRNRTNRIEDYDKRTL